MQKKERGSKREEAQVEEPRKERLEVWTVRQHEAPHSSMNVEWPEFSKESDRIKAYSQRYKDKSIVEAFQANGANITKVNDVANTTPKEYQVGQIVEMKIASVSKSGVVFSTATKQNIISSVNLYKYDKFRHFLPTDPVRVKVTSIRKDQVYVDPLAPMLDDWLTENLRDTDLQRNIKTPKTIEVKNLRLAKGGFIGKAVIPTVSEFVGADYMVDAFIPGSQIVLNIENDFEKWNGKTVNAFVSNYVTRPGTIDQKTLICSVKEYLKFKGDLNIIKLFGHYCDAGKAWKADTAKIYDGQVTGIINSAKKCGVFVEIPELYITGMVSMSPDQLVNYKPQDNIQVRIVDFDENTFYNSTMQQVQHKVPYVIENDILRDCDIKPILELVK